MVLTGMVLKGQPNVNPRSATRVPLLPITSVASTANIVSSMLSQQASTTASTQPQQENVERCRKCRKKNHTMDRCCTKIICKKCKGKDHGTKFCTTAPQPEPKCTFCSKGNILQKTAGSGRKMKKKVGPGGHHQPPLTPH